MRMTTKVFMVLGAVVVSAAPVTSTANRLVVANCSAFMQQAPTTCTFSLQ